jgi:hypothetical protein
VSASVPAVAIIEVHFNAGKCRNSVHWICAKCAAEFLDGEVSQSRLKPTDRRGIQRFYPHCPRGYIEIRRICSLFSWNSSLNRVRLTATFPCWRLI